MERRTSIRRHSDMESIPESEPFLAEAEQRRNSAPARLAVRRRSSIPAELIRFTSPLVMAVASPRCLLLAHWLLSAAVLFLQVCALSFDNWRKVRVNREALLLLWKAGNLPAAVLNRTISFSREQGVYSECVIDSPYRIANLTDPFVQPRCYSILADVDQTGNNDSHNMLLLITAQMYLGPVVLLLTGAAMGLMFVAPGNSAFRRLMLICAAIRTASLAGAVALLLCAFQVEEQLRGRNPSYPVKWPAEVRHRSSVQAWQVGQVNWTIALGLQLVIIGCDLHHCQMPKAKMSPAESPDTEETPMHSI